MLRTGIQAWRQRLVLQNLQKLKGLCAVHTSDLAQAPVTQAQFWVPSRYTMLPSVQHASTRYFTPSIPFWQQGGTEDNQSTSSTAEATAAAGEAARETKDTPPVDEATTAKDELVAKLKEENEALKDKLKLLLADMENLRQRTARQAENAQKFAIQAFVKELLDVPDNLERATETVKKAVFDDGNLKDDVDQDKLFATLKSLLEGVELTDKVLMQIFARNGVERVDPLEQKFDPNQHNALFEVPDLSREPGIVAHVVKVGYLLHGRVVRPAHVGVTKAVP